MMDGMSDAPFHHSGPVFIDGVEHPHGQLRQHTSEHGMTSWEGTVTFTTPPAGFSANVANAAGPIELRLPDGRRGNAHVFVDYNGGTWMLTIQGTGPAPA